MIGEVVSMNSRRGFLATVAGLGLGGAALSSLFSGGRGRAMAQPTGKFAVSLDDAEWHKRLTSAQYNVLRQEGTERAFTSPLNDEHRKGIFACAGCNERLFRSETKFDSGTGWPSFYEPIKGGVGESVDGSLGVTRTEVHCANCGGHLGHVFDDGPRPTGLRYCMNGVALKFDAMA